MLYPHVTEIARAGRAGNPFAGTHSDWTALGPRAVDTRPLVAPAAAGAGAKPASADADANA
jgi:hypothetical protein